MCVVLKRTRTVEEKLFSIEKYFETKSFEYVQACFRRKLHCRLYPDKKLFRKWVKKLWEHRASLNSSRHLNLC